MFVTTFYKARTNREFFFNSFRVVNFPVRITDLRNRGKILTQIEELHEKRAVFSRELFRLKGDPRCSIADNVNAGGSTPRRKIYTHNHPSSTKILDSNKS